MIRETRAALLASRAAIDQDRVERFLRKRFDRSGVR
jgi:hypothetical protein